MQHVGAAAGPLFRPVNKAGRGGDAAERPQCAHRRQALRRGRGDRRPRVRALAAGGVRAVAARRGRDDGGTDGGRTLDRAETVARYTREQDAATGVVARLRRRAVSADGSTPLPVRYRATASAAAGEAAIAKRQWKGGRTDAKRAMKVAESPKKSLRRQKWPW